MRIYFVVLSLVMFLIGFQPIYSVGKPSHILLKKKNTVQITHFVKITLDEFNLLLNNIE